MRQKHYQGDDFLPDSLPDPMDVAVDKKVSLLYQLCILCKSKKDPDAREVAVRKVLSQCTSERALTITLHDVVAGNKSINTFLAQKLQENVRH